ncbi:transmembrane and coiled-coil domain-containing protein 6 isoform X2 [Pseudonaja textilis]|uniref:transmembrane and coiled-coil domain-containing protein 6 isoform X2 n=1 Tax=Pseudonaja textilis TaxID=8673 RepID=UPI000EA94EC7|nr:transmembrane and coiled-coil domain-containing protein 6 isoform X2 [Pseudonaja textilis]
MSVLIGLFTSNLANLQMDAACCLHELSLSTDPDVVEACLPATSYLLTYLSGHSVALMELCLYTLGNLVVEMKAVKKHLLPQGIIPVLASCIKVALRIHPPSTHASLGLFQTARWNRNCSGMCMGSSLHYLQLICPVVRCVGNLLAEDKANNDELVIKEECLLKALFVFMQYFLPKHTFVVRECLWLLNNLTVHSTTFCSALLSLEVFSDLLKLLGSYQMINLLVLTVLCNIAAKGAAYCEMLHQKAVLPSLVNILVIFDVQVIGQDLELLHLIFFHWPKAAIDFVNHSGLHALQQHQNNLHLQEQVKVLIQTVSQITAVPQNKPLGTENLHFIS